MARASQIIWAPESILLLKMGEEPVTQATVVDELVIEARIEVNLFWQPATN